MTTTATTAQATELDVCIGYLVPEHDAPAAELTEASGYLCQGCAERLDREVRPHRYETGIRRAAAPQACPNGHTDRAAHYYDCIYCYGD